MMRPTSRKSSTTPFPPTCQQALLRQFTDLEGLAYQQGQGSAIANGINALNADLDTAAQTLDGNANLADPKTYAKQRAEQTAAERKKLDAAKKNSSKGKGDRTWSEVASEMNVILDKAYKAAISGKGAEGSSLVNDAYYQYYEKLGFEKNVMNAISGDRVSQVEYQFKMTRKTMRDGGSDKEIKKLVDDLKSWLVEDAATLDGGAAGNVNAFTKAITSSAGQAFLILIREGLEALLVVAAVVAYLVKSGNQRFTKWIYLGVLAGLAGSGLIAVLFTFLFGGSGPVQEISEGVCALIAMLMLLWTSNWMLNKSSVEAWNRYIRTKTESAVADAQNKVAADEGVGLGMVVSLAMLSFLAVFREGAETVIFYESIYSMSRDAQGMWIGGIAAGCGAARHLPRAALHLREDSDWPVLPRHVDSDGRAGRHLRRRWHPRAHRRRPDRRPLPVQRAHKRLDRPVSVRRMPCGTSDRGDCRTRAVRRRLRTQTQVAHA